MSMKVSFLKKLFHEDWENFTAAGKWSEAFKYIVQNCVKNQYSIHSISCMKNMLLCAESMKNLYDIDKNSAVNLSIKTTETVGHIIVNNWQQGYKKKHVVYNVKLGNLKVFNEFNINITWVKLSSLYTTNCIVESVIITGKHFSIPLCGKIPKRSYFTNVSLIKFALRTHAEPSIRFIIIY